MLEKGCSPGNAAYEGFFGRLKNELFHSKNWEDVTFDGLSRLPDERIEKSLGHMSPNNTVGAYAQRFRRVRGNRPRPPGVWMNLVIIAAFSVRDSASHRCACPLSVGVRR